MADRVPFRAEPMLATLIAEPFHVSAFAVFDCLYAGGHDLRRLCLSLRREQMIEAIAPLDGLFPSRVLAANGIEAFALARKRGLEGMIAKDGASHYVGGHSKQWLKCKVHQEEELVIGGYTAPAGSRVHFGALLSGAYQDGELRYVGKVGTGFTHEILASLSRAFVSLVRRLPFRNGRPTANSGSLFSLACATTRSRGNA